MVDVANWVRIFAAVPEDDLVEKRTAAVKDLAGKFIKDGSVPGLLKAANDIAMAVDAKAEMPTGLADEVQTSVRKTAAAFVAAGAELETTVCALMAALEVIEGGRPGNGILTKQELFALGLWSALGFQLSASAGQLEALRASLLHAAQALVLNSAHTSRERQNVPDIKAAAPDPGDGAAIATAINTATNAAVSALRNNAQLDREEIELLWWILGDWSELLQVRFSDLENRASATLAAGLEAGAIARRVPSQAHRHLVLRQASPPAEEVSLTDLLKGIGDDRTKLSASFNGDALIDAYPAVFPLLHALRTGLGAAGNSKIKRSYTQWAERALLERAALRVMALLSQPGK